MLDSRPSGARRTETCNQLRLTMSGVYLLERLASRPEVRSCNGCARGPRHRSLSKAACRGQEDCTRQGFFNGTAWRDLRLYAQPSNMHRTGNSRIKFWISGQDFDQPSPWAGHPKLAPNFGPRNRLGNATRSLSIFRDWFRWSSRRTRYVCEIHSCTDARQCASKECRARRHAAARSSHGPLSCLCKVAYPHDFPRP